MVAFHSLLANCSQVKAAFTRTFNKTVHLTPYSTGAAPSKRGRQAPAADEDIEGVLYDEQAGAEKIDSEESDEDISADRMIVVIKLH